MANGQICPVCGKHQFEVDNYFEICPVCGWEDDGIQRDDPDYCGGANGFSLNEYRFIYEGLLRGEDIDDLKRRVFKANEAKEKDEWAEWDEWYDRLS